MPVPLRRRAGLVLLTVLAASGCLALAWWQWTRFESNSGTFQNLGYAVQWPMFAIFCVYAYRKLIRYEEHPPEPPGVGKVTEIPTGLLPERPTSASRAHSGDDDPALRDYNAYLARLARSSAANGADTDADTDTDAEQKRTAP